MYCRVPQWIELIETMCTCGCNIDVQEIDESDECPYVKVRSLGIRGAQEAMEIRVSLRERGFYDSTA
jgi:hypothetical protein